jgi:hypothetical protein
MRGTAPLYPASGKHRSLDKAAKTTKAMITNDTSNSDLVIKAMTTNDTNNSGSTVYGSTFQLRVPGGRLRCACGRSVRASDFEVFEQDRMVRAVCPHCFNLMFEFEARWGNV